MEPHSEQEWVMPSEDSDGKLFKSSSCYFFFIFLLVRRRTTRHVGVNISKVNDDGKDKTW